jgi:hypothetical protein
VEPILARRLRRRPDLAFRTIGDEAFILSTRDQRLHRLNESGTFLWAELDREPSVEALAEALCRAFDVEIARARSDAIAFAERLLSDGLAEVILDPRGAPPEAPCGRS